MVLFKIWPEILKKAIITLQALRFKLNCLNQTCISLKSIMQLTKTIFPDSAIFIEKKRVENRLWRKSEFLWRKKNISSSRTSGRQIASRSIPATARASARQGGVGHMVECGIAANNALHRIRSALVPAAPGPLGRCGAGGGRQRNAARA